MLVLNNSSLLLDFNDAGMDLDTKIMDIYEESQIFLKKYPELRTAIEYDLDNYGLNKKKVRNAQKAYEEQFSVENGEVLFNSSEYSSSSELMLKKGRPRMTVDMVLFFLCLRGQWGSISNQIAAERIVDSISIQAILSFHNHKTPGINTIRENLNKVSSQTLQLLLKCQALYIIENELDDFNEVFIDSTHVAANTPFPTDIDIVQKLLNRVVSSIQKLDKFGIPVNLPCWIFTRLNKMQRHLKYVNMNAGKGIKGKVKERFRSFLKLAGREIRDIETERDRMIPFWENAELGPKKGMALDILWDKIEQDLCDAAYAIHYAERRIEQGIKTPTNEKLLSISDRCASYIAKGQRETVIGYKPQIARSRNGFVCACVTPIGNAADSEMLVPTVKNFIQTTGNVPELVSTDDGYASAAGVSNLKNELGILKVSIGGAKGKKLLDEDLWDHADFVAARTQRSAAESGVFTLKHNHNFGQLLRRGIDAVEAELMEKVIAYNFVHITRLKKRTQEKQKEKELKDRIPSAA